MQKYLNEDVTEKEAGQIWHKGITAETAGMLAKDHHEKLKQERRMSLIEMIEHQASKEVVNEDVPAYAMRMWNEGGWVPFCLSKLHKAIKENPEFFLIAQQYRPCVNQPAYGETLWGWQNYKSDSIYEQIKGLSDLNEVSCSHCAKSYTDREILEGDIKANLQRDPYYFHQMRKRA